MSDPDLPDTVTQRDIDAQVGETVDSDQCEHDRVECENCQQTMEDKDKETAHLSRQMFLRGETSRKLLALIKKYIEDEECECCPGLGLTCRTCRFLRDAKAL